MLDDECPVCGSTGRVDVMTLSSPDPILRACDQCGLSSRPVPTYRRWRGRPECMAAPGWTPGDADFLGGPAFVIDDEPPYVTVWCGPPAPLPLPPTPEEIIAVAWWLTMPQAGQVDLSDHRTYHWGLT